MIAILGTGKMGEAELSGLLRAGQPAADVAAVVRREARGDELRAAYGVPVVSAREAAKNAATLVIAVKPADVGGMLDEIADLVTASQLIISVAAGITTSFIEQRLPVEMPAVRVTSNTPLLVGEAMSLISAGAFASVGHPGDAGGARRAVAGSGPACVYYLIGAMVDAGVLVGLPRRTALEMVPQTVYGAATMV